MNTVCVPAGSSSTVSSLRPVHPVERPTYPLYHHGSHQLLHKLIFSTLFRLIIVLFNDKFSQTVILSILPHISQYVDELTINTIGPIFFTCFSCAFSELSQVNFVVTLSVRLVSSRLKPYPAQLYIML